ncbi:MAG TPA: hypothetical protein PKY87_17590, partial [Terricaulis sp.]|nr:hypothetical protein [Terricaulis sp.]
CRGRFRCLRRVVLEILGHARLLKAGATLPLWSGSDQYLVCNDRDLSQDIVSQLHWTPLRRFAIVRAADLGRKRRKSGV